MKETKSKTEKNEKIKEKRHFDFGRSAGKIIALLLSIMMVVATGGTVIYYIVLKARGLV